MEELRCVAQKVQEEIKNAGIEKARFSVEEKETQEFSMENGEFSLYRTLFDKDLSVTVFPNQKKGSGSTNKLDDASIKAVVEGALASAESAVPDEAYDIAPKQENQAFEAGTYEPDMDLLFARTKELAEDIKKEFPKIQVMLMMVSHEKNHEIYWNTNGTEFERFYGCYNLMIEFSANEGDKTTSLAYASVRTATLEQPFIEMAAVKRKLADTVKQLDVKPMEGKFTGTVVLMPECVDEFLGYICSNFTSDSVILEKTSIWLDKLGEQVADPRVSVTFDPMHEQIISRERYTYDGFVSEPEDFIKDGVLSSFKTSLYVANKSGVKPAKNTSYCMVMQPGDTSFEDIIKNTKQGLLLGGFSGGQPGTNGEISGVAKNSFLIEDGKITTAVNEVMITGNLADMIQNVVAISKETLSEGTSVMPYVAVDGVVVSGKE
ncbi:MAG: TldD/PmbA family protein [Lachnospiraceae bacterium]|nr:TldD/PmbA family protein [Lachnospiraceae bacterium]